MMTEPQSTPALAERADVDAPPRRLRIALFIVLVFGIFIRIYPTANHSPSAKVNPAHPNTVRVGFDEDCYRHYLTMLEAKGLAAFPAIGRNYIAVQPELPFEILPPMRVTFLASAYLWHRAWKASPLFSLHAVSCTFTTLGFVVAALFALRLGGYTAAVAITALMSCAPLGIQMAQRAYIDGIFTFAALLTLWLLWENLRAPDRPGWLTAYAFSLAFMVMTKENAAFVFGTILGIITLNRWLAFGKVTASLLAATFLGPLLGVIGLIVAAGNIQTLFDIYRLNVAKSQLLPYAFKTGAGPWYRYIIDLLLISPVLTLLAIAGFLNLRRTEKPAIYFAVFVAFTYLMMANVKYGINVRYASIWDMPMRWLAFRQLSATAVRLPPQLAGYFLPCAVVLLCLLDLGQYFTFFVRHGLYDPIPQTMLRILDILK
jgi:4-amino-4-deoxy-L-arabinose transferase-like glycosyltransferase